MSGASHDSARADMFAGEIGDIHALAEGLTEHPKLVHALVEALCDVHYSGFKDGGKFVDEEHRELLDVAENALGQAAQWLERERDGANSAGHQGQLGPLLSVIRRAHDEVHNAVAAAVRASDEPCDWRSQNGSPCVLKMGHEGLHQAKTVLGQIEIHTEDESSPGAVNISLAYFPIAQACPHCEKPIEIQAESDLVWVQSRDVSVDDKTDDARKRSGVGSWGLSGNRKVLPKDTRTTAEVLRDVAQATAKALTPDDDVGKDVDLAFVACFNLAYEVAAFGVNKRTFDAANDLVQKHEGLARRVQGGVDGTTATRGADG